MKKVITLILTTLLLIIGCSDSSSILEPEEDYTVESLSKGRPILVNNDQKLILTDDSDIIILEDDSDRSDLLNNFDILSRENDASSSTVSNINNNLNTIRDYTGDNLTSSKKKAKDRLSSVKTIMSKNFTVNGVEGGTLQVKHRWKNKGKRVKLSAKLKIPEGAFEGDLTFDMIFDLENYALELYPSPFKFDKPLLLDLIFSNINFSNLDLQNTDFVYLDGEEEMKYEKITFDPENGTIEVKGAQLNHFSRYGWTRIR